MDSTAAPQAGESPFAPPLPGNPHHHSGPRDPGDAWVEGDRGRFWGRFGSAGLLVHDAGKGILLQHRALWSHQGGTWGLPGGALHQGEEAIPGALREAREEAAVPPENVRVLFTSVFDVGYWSYTTVVAEALEPFEAAISDPESLDLQWVGIDAVGSKQLHPGFAAAWPGLRSRLTKARRNSGEA
jgi:8-oxo-dGTP pyrophosphatase MutT (NUDIX family)